MTEKVTEALSGKKSYLAAGGLVLLGVAVALGYADADPNLVEGVKVALLSTYLCAALALAGNEITGFNYTLADGDTSP